MRTLSLPLLLVFSLNATALESLTPEEMANATGGTIYPEIAYLDALNRAVENAQQNEELSDQENLDALFGLAGLVLLPFTQAINADREVVGVHYGDRVPVAVENGTSLALPVLVERISYRNIRPAAGENNPSMGDVHIEGLSFSDDAYIIVKEK